MANSDPRRSRGALGERLAERHLAAGGFRVLERNFRTRYGELDVVSRTGDCLVFCEVKTRTSGGRCGPAKRRQLRLMAAQWLAAQVGSERDAFRSELRFDAIGVTLSPSGALVSLEHVEDAF